MTNFNHERMTISVGTTRAARVALSAAFEYVLKREAFGKPLMDQPVVRHRLAKAGALLESQWAWVEQFAYQLTQMKKEDSDVALGGLTGLLKANAGIALKECTDTAVLLFGGNGYTQSGQGELVESEFSNPLLRAGGQGHIEAGHSPRVPLCANVASLSAVERSPRC